MSRYARLSLKTVERSLEERAGLLAEKENPFSANNVTGESLNFPIAGTCKPSALCVQTCYAACGPITWDKSLLKQWRNHNSCAHDPVAYAERVLAHRRQPFITWNGSGDLFPASVEAVNHIGRTRPDIPQWVRTRHPEMAGLIEEAPNTWVHFSIDATSRDRAAKVKWRTSRYHLSYQYGPGEEGPWPEGMRVVFGHDYTLPAGVDGPASCLLNQVADIARACIDCRRCFSPAGPEQEAREKAMLAGREPAPARKGC